MQFTRAMPTVRRIALPLAAVAVLAALGGCTEHYYLSGSYSSGYYGVPAYVAPCPPATIYAPPVSSFSFSYFDHGHHGRHYGPWHGWSHHRHHYGGWHGGHHGWSGGWSVGSSYGRCH